MQISQIIDIRTFIIHLDAWRQIKYTIWSATQCIKLYKVLDKRLVCLTTFIRTAQLWFTYAC